MKSVAKIYNDFHTLSFCQIRSSITTLLFSGREFSWIRHLLIAAAILAFNNMLVIFVPTIRDIFGFIGEDKSFKLTFRVTFSTFSLYFYKVLKTYL